MGHPHPTGLEQSQKASQGERAVLNFERCLEPVGAKRCSKQRTTCRAWEVRRKTVGLAMISVGAGRALRPVSRQPKQIRGKKTELQRA